MSKIEVYGVCDHDGDNFLYSSEPITEMTDEEVEEESAFLGEDIKINANNLRGIVKTTMDSLKELQEAKIYAARLANIMRSQIKGLKEDDPEFVLCDDLSGVLTQIDNMSAILSKKYRPGDYN